MKRPISDRHKSAMPPIATAPLRRTKSRGRTKATSRPLLQLTAIRWAALAVQSHARAALDDAAVPAPVTAAIREWVRCTARHYCCRSYRYWLFWKVSTVPALITP